MDTNVRRVVFTVSTRVSVVAAGCKAARPRPGSAGSLRLAAVSKAKQNAYMAKTATVTVRIPESLKERLEARALREHRSLSAQIEHELSQTVAAERTPGLAKAGTLLGRFAGKKVPTGADVQQVRAALWKQLERD